MDSLLETHLEDDEQGFFFTLLLQSMLAVLWINIYMYSTDEERFASEVLSDQIIEPSADVELVTDVGVVEQGLFLDDLTKIIIS